MRNSEKLDHSYQKINLYHAAISLFLQPWKSHQKIVGVKYKKIN